METLCPVCEHRLSPIPDERGFIQCTACGLKVPRAAGMGLSCLGPGADLSNLRLDACLPPDLRERFQVEGLLGVGGMGTVFRARCLASGRIVAIKLLTAFENPVLRARFMREGAVMARLRHGNIAQVLEVQTTRRIPYLVCEYLGGGTLKERIKREGPMPIAIAISVMKAVLSALGSCHDHGIIHRDLKPQNILFDTDGTPKLTDLGIARDLWDRGAHLTVTGMIIGTPTYMAPEQLRGEPVNTCADLYAAGAVLMEMVSGEPPKGVATRPAILARMPEKGEQAVRLAAIIARCLSIEPAERPSSARILARELTRPVSTQVARAVPPPARQAPPRLVGGVIMAGLVVGVSVLALLQQAWVSHAPRPPQWVAVRTDDAKPLVRPQENDAPVRRTEPARQIASLPPAPRVIVKTQPPVVKVQEPAAQAQAALQKEPVRQDQPVEPRENGSEESAGDRTPGVTVAARGSIHAGSGSKKAAGPTGTRGATGSKSMGGSISSVLEVAVPRSGRTAGRKLKKPAVQLVAVAPPPRPVIAPPAVASAPAPAPRSPAPPPVQDACSRPNEWQKDTERLQAKGMKKRLTQSAEEAGQSARATKAKLDQADETHQEEMLSVLKFALAVEMNSKAELQLSSREAAESFASTEAGLKMLQEAEARGKGDEKQVAAIRQLRLSLLLIRARAAEAEGRYDEAANCLEERIRVPEAEPPPGKAVEFSLKDLSEFDLANFLSAHELQPERCLELRQRLMEKWERDNATMDFRDSRTSYACALRKAGREAEADELLTALKSSKTGRGGSGN